MEKVKVIFDSFIDQVAIKLEPTLRDKISLKKDLLKNNKLKEILFWALRQSYLEWVKEGRKKIEPIEWEFKRVWEPWEKEMELRARELVS